MTTTAEKQRIYYQRYVAKNKDKLNEYYNSEGYKTKKRARDAARYQKQRENRIYCDTCERDYVKIDVHIAGSVHRDNLANKNNAKTNISA